MDLDIQRCPRCNRILAGGACAFCAHADRNGTASSMPPRGASSVAPGPASQHPFAMAQGSKHPSTMPPASWSQQPSAGPPGGRSQHPPSMAPGPRSGHPSSRPPGAGSQFPGSMSDEARMRTAAQRIAALRPPEAHWSPWWRRIGGVLALALLLGIGWAQCIERPAWRGLAVDVDGPEPPNAPTVFFFLHGYGGSNGDVAWLSKPLRAAGVTPDTAIVYIQGPYGSALGRDWGDDSSETAVARERIKAAIADTLGPLSAAGQRVYIGGFSQGAQIAAEVASVESRITGVVLIAPCNTMRTELFNDGVRVLVAHGLRDRLCQPANSSELVQRLEKQRFDVELVSFEDDHVIAPAAIEAMGAFLAPPPEKK